MRYIKVLMLLSIFSLATYAVCFPAAALAIEEDFPKIGYVKSETADIKAGDNANFETLCTLEKSETVKIIGKRYSWFKILLPKNAYLYIKKEYVDLSSEEGNVGIVNANSVNLRAGAGTRYSILGQVSKPDRLNIIAEEDDWYKIEPPYGSGGWVNSSHIDVSQEDVEYTDPKKIVSKIPKETKKEGEILKLKPEPVKGNLIIH